MAPKAIAQNKMMVQILLYLRLIAIGMPEGVSAMVGERGVMR